MALDALSAACLAGDFVESQGENSPYWFLHNELEVEAIALPGEKVFELRCRDSRVAATVDAAIESGWVKCLPGWLVRSAVAAHSAP